LNESSLLSEIIKSSDKSPSLINKFQNILNEQGLEKLFEWKKLSDEAKKIFPIGLVLILDEAAGSKKVRNNNFFIF
jgi:hypothetical protein